jgi:hypothetical protein
MDFDFAFGVSFFESFHKQACLFLFFCDFSHSVEFRYCSSLLSYLLQYKL